MCIQQVASNTIKVLIAQDTPHFTFDAVLDMLVQQEGVFAGQLLSPVVFADGCQVHTFVFYSGFVIPVGTKHMFEY